MPASRLAAWLKPAVLVGFLAAAVYYFRFTEHGRAVTPEYVLAGIESHGPVTARLIYVAVYIVGTVLLLPGTVLSFAGAVLFGAYEGTLYTWIGATVGATLAYLAARLLGRDFVERLFGGRFAAFDRRLREHGFTGLLIIRLLPIFPFNAVNFGSGLTGIRFRDYVLATAIGIVPGTFVYQFLFARFGRKILSQGIRWAYLADPELWLAVGLFAAFLIVGRWLSARVSGPPTRTFPATVIQPEDIKTMSAPTRPECLLDDIPELDPLDEYNRALAANVHPADWQNPEPAGRYNLVVIGAGTAGLVTAAGAAGLGAKVALVEKKLMGGDCLNVGCVPSKALLRSARAFAAVRDAGRFGVRVPSGTAVDFPAVMERMRRLRARLSPNDSARRFRDLGVDVFIGEARFTARDAVEVAGRTLRFARAVIATGARAAEPAVPGLKEVGCLTNETVFSLTELPPRLAVIGAGPIGCELAQAFARFGSEVYLVEALHGVLPREDREAAEVVRQALLRDGVRIMCCGKDLMVSRGHDGTRLTVDSHGEHYDLAVDRVLVGAGRAPNVEGLGLEAAGVQYGKAGVAVDDRLRTTNPHVYAAGDVCSKYQFTHAADAMARIVIQNALFHGRARASDLVMPWCTYTDPEVAHVGLYEHEAQDRDIDTRTFRQDFKDVDRAVLDGEDEGFVKVLASARGGKILGATVVAGHAGDLVSELTLAMVSGKGLGTIARTIHPYPTQAEAVKKVGDAYNQTRLTPAVKWLFGKWLSWTR